jgi:mRNA interferase RelE/StbE
VTYDLVVSRTAIKALAELDKPQRRRLWTRVRALGEDPRPAGTKALSPPLKGYYRVRVGRYRILYAVDDDAGVVRVARVGTRSSVYDGALPED